MDFEVLLKSGGVVGLIILILFIIFLPRICIIILGIYLANFLGLNGIVWWSFLILFYLIIMGLLNRILN